MKSKNSVVIAGGSMNSVALAYAAVIGGGRDNQISGRSSVVLGGAMNVQTGNYSTIPGGILNTVSGHSAFAAGKHTSVTHDYAAVFGLESSSAGCLSEGDNEVKFCVDDQVYINGVAVDPVARRLSAVEAVGKAQQSLDLSTKLIAESDVELVIAEQDKMLHAALVERERLMDRLTQLEHQTDALLSVLGSRA